MFQGRPERRASCAASSANPGRTFRGQRARSRTTMSNRPMSGRWRRTRLAEDPADIVSVHGAGELLLADDITDPPDAAPPARQAPARCAASSRRPSRNRPGEPRPESRWRRFATPIAGAHVPTNYTASRARPLARRARNTLRPPAGLHPAAESRGCACGEPPMADKCVS